MTSARSVIAFAFVAIASTAFVDFAYARGGGSNFMNSPGYQRRLQESRGFVTTYSNGYPQRGPLYNYRHRQATRYDRFIK